MDRWIPFSLHFSFSRLNVHKFLFLDLSPTVGAIKTRQDSCVFRFPSLSFFILFISYHSPFCNLYLFHFILFLSLWLSCSYVFHFHEIFMISINPNKKFHHFISTGVVVLVSVFFLFNSVYFPTCMIYCPICFFFEFQLIVFRLRSVSSSSFVTTVRFI